MYTWRSRLNIVALQRPGLFISWSFRSQLKIGDAKEWNGDFALEGSRKVLPFIHWTKA